jgi:5-dehydro-2-deoxygluconokinase
MTRRAATGNGSRDATPAFDLIAMGRVGMDVYPNQSGPLCRVRTFTKSIGGTATNVAVACARYDRTVALITKVGDDAIGRYVRAAIGGFGVDTRYVAVTSELPTPVVFCELDPPEEPRIIFYRYPKAPDMEISTAELDLDAIRRCRMLWVTGSGLSDEPHRSALLSALSVRDKHQQTVLDLDWRPSFWPEPAAAAGWYRQALASATITIGNRAEAAVAVGSDDPEEAAQKLLEQGPRVVVVKLGADGVLVATRHATTTIPAVPVRVVCALGAGDAFGGAFCHRLLAGDPAPQAARFANAAGAIVASRLLCADAMPDETEVRMALAASA